MQRSAAVQKLAKLIGKEFGYRINDKAATRDERAAANEQLPHATAERTRLDEAVRQRREAILAADEEYQRLLAERLVAVRHEQRLLGDLRSFKITVGKSVAGLFFSVKAEGDSWEEVITKLQAER